ncbi:MAG: type II toxin-antitoxin system HicA family toxin [Acidobacteriota bacterium]|jgi:predicted RNA binding protein YcfA (HicA-like mRNA interferase family)|nr:type II toxin-antitoxin system HicA family toxin [Acidobacteriota bacterium]
MNEKEVIKRLEKEGWVVVRIKGSHHWIEKGDKGFPVPVHGAKDLKKGVLARISKDAGIKL